MPGTYHGEHTTGLVTYFLPLQGGGKKHWATETEDFFCCHGTLVQANAALNSYFAYQDEKEIYVCQYFDSDVHCQVNGQEITLSLREDNLINNRQLSSFNAARQSLNGKDSRYANRPDFMLERVVVHTAAPVEFGIHFRLPFWRMGQVKIFVNGERMDMPEQQGFAVIFRKWQMGDQVEIMIPRGLKAEELPDEPGTVAFLYGPILLAGLCDEERTLYTADPMEPEKILKQEIEREWGAWITAFRALGQPKGLHFKPLYEIGYERYSVYFPIEKKTD